MRTALVLSLLVAACEPPGWGRHTVGPDASSGQPDAPRAHVDAASDGPAVACMEPFSLAGYATASSVLLTGDFTHWAGTVAAGAIAMTDSMGTWSVTYGFARGTYQYKFVVDGSQWIADPGNPNSVPDGFGGKNSIYTCQ